MSYKNFKRFSLREALLVGAVGGAVGLFGFDGAAEPAGRHGPSLVQPLDGAVVGRQVTVRIGFAGGGPQGLAEDSGIVLDGRPAPQMEPKPTRNLVSRGPSDGTGLSATVERKPRGPHFAMLVDAPAPQPGSPFQPDDQHIPFPVGLPQMTVTLPPGEHRLTLVKLDGKGSVSQSFYDPATTRVIVRQ